MLRSRKFLILLLALMIPVALYNFRFFSSRRPARPARVAPPPGAVAPAPGAVAGAPAAVAAAPSGPTESFPLFGARVTFPAEEGPKGGLRREGLGGRLRNPFLTAKEADRVARGLPLGPEPEKTAKGEAAPKMKLEGLLFQGGRRTAIINGQVVSPGDQVGGETVLEINPGGVVLGSGDRRIVLKLKESLIRLEARPPTGR